MKGANNVVFNDRRHAGFLLSQKLAFLPKQDSLALGLARGGAVVASVVGKELLISFDVLVVKKIRMSQSSELALGAVAPGGISTVNWQLVHGQGLDEQFIRSQIMQLSDEILQKTALYRKRLRVLNPQEKTVIIIDDGAATGATIEAAILWCKAMNTKRIIIALPVAHPEVVRKIASMVEDCVVLDAPKNFESVGQFYKDFSQVTDQEVVQLLH